MTLADAQVAAPAAAAPHIVDVLIAERAPRLAASAAWPLLRPLLYATLHYGDARRMADAVAPLPGRAAVDYVSGLLAVTVEARGLERIPRDGACIVVCNHPTGIADGIAVYDALKAVRPDLVFYANADALRVSPRLGEILIPVEWVESKRTRDRTRLTLEMTRAAMEAGRCLVVFPAGRLARRQPDGTLADPPWAATPVSLCRKYGAPVVPIHVAGPNSRLFHLFHRFSPELRDITLFHEMLNKRGRSFSLLVGPPIRTDAFQGAPAEAVEALKAYVERVLPSDPDGAFA